VRDFSLSVLPASETIPEGNTGLYLVTVTPVRGFAGAVSLSCSGGPSTTKCIVFPTAVTLDGSRPAFAAVVASVAPGSQGTFTFTITGAAGTQSHSVDVQLTILGPSD
jgi:serine protease AprX